MMNRLISIAPMMDWTDRHDRYFLRLISPHVLLYTEMVTTSALIYGEQSRFLAFHPFEHPLALQLGGNDPTHLAQCAEMGARAGFDEINLNVGCPSDRVKSGCFGAALMLEPKRVADCVAAMCQSNLPVTVKCRLGVDHHDSYEELQHFIQCVSSGGCNIFIVHARKAWLTGLSPKENREIPPLQYDTVKQLKQDFPQLTIIVNGGIKTLTQIDALLEWADGVMIGREAYTNPYILAEIEHRYFTPDTPIKTRGEIIEAFIPYVEEELKKKVKLSHMTRHILGLFQHQKGGRLWRRYLSENSHQPNAGIDVIYKALEKVIGE